MNKEELREVRRQLRSHYDALKTRAKGLETEKPVFREVINPLNLLFGVSPYFLIVDHYEIKPPRIIRSDLRFCENELKIWGNVEGNDKRLNAVQHSDNEEIE